MRPWTIGALLVAIALAGCGTEGEAPTGGGGGDLKADSFGEDSCGQCQAIQTDCLDRAVGAAAADDCLVEFYDCIADSGVSPDACAPTGCTASSQCAAGEVCMGSSCVPADDPEEMTECDAEGGVCISRNQDCLFDEEVWDLDCGGPNPGSMICCVRP